MAQKKGSSKEKDRAFLGVNIPKDLKMKLQKIADRDKRSLNATVEIFLDRGVCHLEEEPEPQKVAA